MWQLQICLNLNLVCKLNAQYFTVLEIYTRSDFQPVQLYKMSTLNWSINSTSNPCLPWRHHSRRDAVQVRCRLDWCSQGWSTQQPAWPAGGGRSQQTQTEALSSWCGGQMGTGWGEVLARCETEHVGIWWGNSGVVYWYGEGAETASSVSTCL